LFQTLEDIKKNGVERSMFEQTLHQVEFSAKKTKQNTGLMYISHMVPHALHGGDPLNMFKINDYSIRIREEFEKGGLFEGLIDKHLANNSHYLRLMYTADATKADRDEKAEVNTLKTLAESLSEAEVKHIIDEAAMLQKHQE
jgi:Zn-dependent M16 (insulinase) family peptidase